MPSAMFFLECLLKLSLFESANAQCKACCLSFAWGLIGFKGMFKKSTIRLSSASRFSVGERKRKGDKPRENSQDAPRKN